MEKLIRDCYDTVKPGGTVALLIEEFPTASGRGIFDCEDWLAPPEA